MMKMTKPTHKLHKPLKSSPIRRDPLMKRPMHASLPMRMPSSSSRPMVKRLSPGMRRPMMPPSKGVHSTRVRPGEPPMHRSIARQSMQQAPVEMARGYKASSYEKRKMSPPPGAMQGPPYHDERYLGSRACAPRPPHYPSPPPKKKAKRPEEPSMLMRHHEMPFHPEDRMVPPLAPMHHRGHMGSSANNERDYPFDGHPRGHDDAPMASHSKRPPPSVPYNHPAEKYSSPPRTNRGHYDAKKFAPTLNERFASVADSGRSEPRVKYTREDLEKITIDIHRTLKAETPTIRHIVNPNDVKLVRRSNEGRRPMFDREEIKQAPRDMRDEAHYEKKVTGYSSGHSMGLPRDIENYEITRHRFDSHNQSFHSEGGHSLGERWQEEIQKEAPPMDRDHREDAYERPPVKRGFSDSRASKTGDRDFRSERYPGPPASQARNDYSQNQEIPPHSEPRISSAMHRKPAPPMEARRKLSVPRESIRSPPATVRPDPKSRYEAIDKRYHDNMPPKSEKPIHRRSPAMESYSMKPKSRPDGRDMPSFSRKPDKHDYKPGPQKYDEESRYSSNYESVRGSSDSYRGRGGTFRSPRGRSFLGMSRGSPRSSFPPRTFSRGGYRGRGAPTKRGRNSPAVWEHDMYSQTSDH